MAKNCLSWKSYYTPSIVSQTQPCNVEKIEMIIGQTEWRRDKKDEKKKGGKKRKERYGLEGQEVKVLISSSVVYIKPEQKL